MKTIKQFTAKNHDEIMKDEAKKIFDKIVQPNFK
jgi:hypothetical protein